MARPIGLILYQGPSEIDGKPIVVIGTFRSKNRKTGPLVQTWIIRDDLSPLVAAQSGEDKSVCGDCAFRWSVTGLCYVNLIQAPRGVYEAYKAGSYSVYEPAEHDRYFAGRTLRVGSYGDPAAVPFKLWKQLVTQFADHVGYTHQWARFPEFRTLVMASCNSEFEAICAQASGWRTFRTRNTDQPLMPSEVSCPASPEGGNRRTCETCKGCDGNLSASHKRKSFAIVAHGSPPKRNRLAEFHREHDKEFREIT